jgi:putative ABC transport system substrate-binding protein
MARERAFVLLPTSFSPAHGARLAGLALRRRVPAVAQGRAFVGAGGLMARGPSQVDLARRAASYVDRILKGAKPAELPVEQPTKFELVISRRTANVLGLTIPHSIPARAGEVIE